MLTGVIGCVCGNKEAIKPFVLKLSKKLNIKDTKILVQLLELASGNLSAIDKLNNNMQKALNPKEINLVTSFIWLARKFRDYKSKTKDS
jgi:hypothetical protein